MVLIVGLVVAATIGGLIAGLFIGYNLGWHARDLRMAVLKEELARLKCMQSLGRLAKVAQKVVGE